MRLNNKTTTKNFFFRDCIKDSKTLKSMMLRKILQEKDITF